MGGGGNRLRGVPSALGILPRNRVIIADSATVGFIAPLGRSPASMAALDHPVASPPISFGYRRRRRLPNEHPLRWAWAFLLIVGLPFALMGVLTTIARAGVYVDLFRPLWQPWPPDVLKPFLGFGIFAASLAYLAYCAGKRSGFQSGIGVGIASTRNWVEEHTPPPAPASTTPVENPPPPPPSPNAESFDELDLAPPPN